MGMKTVVSLQDLIEYEIKPNALLAEYRRLAEAWVAQRWHGCSDLVEAACPGCGSTRGEAAFEKLGLSYRTCGDCGSLFVSPRPSERDLADYYRHSDAARFWRDEILAATATARLEKIVQPRANWVIESVAEHAGGSVTAVDVSPQSAPLVLELLAGPSPFRRIVAAHHAADVDHGAAGAYEVRPCASGELASLGPADVVLAFDAIDRAANVRALVGAIGEVLKPGGLLFVTAPCISGFDLQVLWDRSPTIMPPDKLNLLSARGFLDLFAGPRWAVLEFSTPGMFDAQIVQRMVRADPRGDWPRFVRQLAELTDENALVEFQGFLQRYRLASFARLVVCRTL